MSKKPKIGRCALTGQHGKFVKCHIIPQSLTKPSEDGAPLFQSTKGKGALRRWTSWYDPSLVTREGEEILSLIDDRAIKELRKNHLIWSSWTAFSPQFAPLGATLPSHGLRKVNIEDSDALIRFAHSIAWRASASQLSEMDEATLNIEIQDRLKDYILGEKIEGASSFPVSVVQISTIGEIHNQTPYLNEKHFPDVGDGYRSPQKILRIYVDGLIFHIHLSPIPLSDTSKNPIFIGASDHLLVMGVSYKASFQHENLTQVKRETFQ